MCVTFIAAHILQRERMKARMNTNDKACKEKLNGNKGTLMRVFQKQFFKLLEAR